MAGVLCAAFSGAWADDAAPWVAQGLFVWSQESNLLRFSDAEVASGLTTSDTARTARLSLGWHPRWGRQRLNAELALGRQQFSRFSLYNHDEHDLHLGWDWQTADHLSGAFQAHDLQHLSQLRPYGIGLLTVPNLESTQQVQALARWGLASTMGLEASLEGRRVEYSAQQARADDYHQHTAGLAWRSAPSAAMMWGLGLRATQGRYPHRFEALTSARNDDAFQGRFVDLILQWMPEAGRSPHQWDGRLSSGRTTYDVDTSRNVSGLFGRVRWLWQPLAGLHLDTAWTREPGQDAYFATLVAPAAEVRGPAPAAVAPIEATRLTHKLQLMASADVTAKTQVQLGAGTVRRSLAGIIATPPLAAGQDRSESVRLGLQWQPARQVRLNCAWEHERREGEAPWSSSWRNRTTTCQGQLTLK